MALRIIFFNIQGLEMEQSSLDFVTQIGEALDTQHSIIWFAFLLAHATIT